MIEMAGLAQKGGAVHIHCRLAERPEDISAIRVATGEAHAVIGGDLVTTAGAKTLGLMRTGQTGAVVNAHEIITGDFTRDTEFRLPSDRLRLSLEARLKDRVAFFDAQALAKALLGDSIFSNMMIFGAAWQMGLVPLSEAAIMRAIELNRAAVDGNKRAFEIGRWADRASRGGAAGDDAERGGEAQDAGRANRLPRAAPDGLSGRRLCAPLPRDGGPLRGAAAARGRGVGLPQGAGLQGRVRGRAAPSGDARQGPGGVRRGPQAHLPPRSAGAHRQGRQGPPGQARVRPVDRAVLPSAGPDEAASRHACRSVRPLRGPAPGARADRAI